MFAISAGPKSKSQAEEKGMYAFNDLKSGSYIIQHMYISEIILNHPDNTGRGTVYLKLMIVFRDSRDKS